VAWVLLVGSLGLPGCGSDDGATDAADSADTVDSEPPDGSDASDLTPDVEPIDDGGGEVEPDADVPGEGAEATEVVEDGVAAVCGNAVPEGDEACDDGNDVPGDGCENDCSFSCRGAADCDDGDPCTADSCEAVSGGRACARAAAPGVACDDGDPCTAGDVCDAGGGCAGVPVPPAAPVPLAPANGAYAGGVVLPEWLSPLRPTFRWSAPAGGCPGGFFQIEVDDSCDAAGFSACAFPSPEASAVSVSGPAWSPTADLPASTVPPVGRRYYWRVRECRATICSAWSPVRRVDVGRAPMDFDGDGYSDLAIGAFGGATQEGVAFVYRGSATGLGTAPVRTLTLPGNPVGTGFGMAVAWAGDLDADGFGDLAVGAPFVDGSGAVHVYRGSAAGIPAAATVVLRVPGTPANALFGRSLAAAGDLDGDGYDDLVAGASGFDGATWSEGAAYVFRGGATGPSATAAAVLRQSPVERGARFGYAVAGGGDVDGDGYADLLIGASFADGAGADTGAAWLFRGGASGVSSTPAAAFVDPVPELGSQFGFAVVIAGDLDADGLADVAVGAPLHDGTVANEGRVYVWYGTAGTFPAAPPVVLADPSPGLEAHFGGALGSAGDINRNGSVELLVGAELKDAGSAAEGNAFVYYGGPGGIPAAPTGTFDNPTGEVNGMFGVATVSAGDVNGDGYGDLAIGAWVQDGDVADEGVAFLYHGCSCGVISPVPVLTLDHPLDRFDGRFGFAISAGAGR
jgi:cysteine-rich repeat protein